MSPRTRCATEPAALRLGRLIQQLEDALPGRNALLHRAQRRLTRLRSGWLMLHQRREERQQVARIVLP